MSSSILDESALVTCAHGAPAMVTVSTDRVRLLGRPVATLPSPYLISGCPHVVSGMAAPCTEGRFLVGASRIQASGVPVLLEHGPSASQPAGAPLIVASCQQRVRAG